MRVMNPMRLWISLLTWGVLGLTWSSDPLLAQTPTPPAATSPAASATTTSPAGLLPMSEPIATPKRSVFSFPGLMQSYATLNQQLLTLMQAQQFNDALPIATQLVELFPELPDTHYNLACVHAQLGDNDAAFGQLLQACAQGYSNLAQIRNDPDLKRLHDDPRWTDLQTHVTTSKARPLERREVRPNRVGNRIAIVSEENTAYHQQLHLLFSLFEFPPPPDSVTTTATTTSPAPSPTTSPDATTTAPDTTSVPTTATAPAPPAPGITPVITGDGPLEQQLRLWQSQHRIATNHGDLYDNRDDGHSPLNLDRYPTLTAIQYSPQARQFGVHRGLQQLLLYNAPTLGNASLASVSGPFWRSMPRYALVEQRGTGLLFLQYTNNQLYIYPEHRDHDPGHNGQPSPTGDGHGDVYAANTPYLIISQGSSGSDQVFLQAFASTLAAFKPEVKLRLIETKWLMPTLQYIFRISQKNHPDEAAYLTGLAHPTVFDGSQIDALRMAERAQALTLDTLPPLASLQMVREDAVQPGIDYFDVRPNEKIFDTAHAIARVMRSTAYTRTYVLSAHNSRDLNQRPLTYHWVLLRGDPAKVRFKPLDETSSRMQIQIDHHQRMPTYPGSPIASNRVDIGLFVHNGFHYSAPAFLSLYYLDNEARTYDAQQRILSVQYSGADTPGHYTDPLLDAPKDWRDDYQYDPTGTLQGWQRTLANTVYRFNRAGQLIATRSLDAPQQWQPTDPRPVKYVIRPRQENRPVLEMLVE